MCVCVCVCVYCVRVSPEFCDGEQVVWYTHFWAASSPKRLSRSSLIFANTAIETRAMETV